MHRFRRQPAERPTFPLENRVEDGVPTQDIAGERLLMAAGALPCPCKVRHLYVSLLKLFIFHVSSLHKVQTWKRALSMYRTTVRFQSDPV